MQGLFDQFLKEKRFLKNITPKTAIFLCKLSKSFVRTLGEIEPSSLNKAKLNEFVVRACESGLSAVSCNTYISGINSFLTWLYENGHTTEHLSIKQLKEEKRAIQMFKDDQLKALLGWKPRGFYEWRLYALVCLIMDTGVRIKEALTVELSKVDFDNLLITVYGKGSKERKVLWNYLKVRKAPGRLLFCTTSGNNYTYDNSPRDFKNLCKRLNI